MRANAISRSLIALVVFALVFGDALEAAEIKVASLNCHRLSAPIPDGSESSRGHGRLTRSEYEQKILNLSSLMEGYDVVALQEVGGAAEISALAVKSGMLALPVPDRGIGLIYKLPGWNVRSLGRVDDLEPLVRRHLLVEAVRDSKRILFLVIHLDRASEVTLPNYRRQVELIGNWMRAETASDPDAVLVVLGDVNSGREVMGASIFGIGSDAGWDRGIRSTHIRGRPMDRMVLAGPAVWKSVEVRSPPFGNRPQAALVRLWTDHFLIGAVLCTLP